MLVAKVVKARQALRLRRDNVSTICVTSFSVIKSFITGRVSIPVESDA
jgi:hypothetical protein